MLSDSDSNSLYSESEDETTTSAAGGRFVWKSSWQYIMCFLIYCTTLSDFGDDFDSEDSEPTYAQCTICIFLIGMPMLYTQIAIGQYVKVGALHLKYMCPFAQGVGFTILLSTILHLIPCGVLIGDCFLYFFSCFQSRLPWLECPVGSSGCWSDYICKTSEPCISDTMTTAAHFYWNHTYMKLNFNEYDSVQINWRRVIATFIVCASLYICTLFTMKFNSKILWYIFTIGFCTEIFITSIIMFVDIDGYPVVTYLIEVNIDNLLSVKNWMAAICEIVNTMNLSHCGHFLLGSYLDNDQSSGTLAVASAVVAWITHTTSTVISETCLIILRYTANISTDDMKKHKEIYNGAMMTIRPYTIGKVHGYHLLTIIYYVGVLMLNSVYCLVNLKVIEATLEDSYPILTKYRKYIHCFLLTFCVIGSILHCINSTYNYVQIYMKLVFQVFQVFVAFTLSVVISWIYGVGRLSDDIHYITGSQPALFWKVTWFAMPFFFGWSSFLGLIKLNQYDLASVFLIALLTSVIWLLALVQIYRYIKMKNMIALFHSEELWGPPNSHERYLRRIYNPKDETKSCRRDDKCAHKCLLRNKIMQRIVYQELKLN